MAPPPPPEPVAPHAPSNNVIIKQTSETVAALIHRLLGAAVFPVVPHPIVTDLFRVGIHSRAELRLLGYVDSRENLQKLV